MSLEPNPSNPPSGFRQWLNDRVSRDIGVAHRLWSVRIAFGWAIVAGCWVALPAFQSFMPPWVFGLLCVGMSLAICVARLTNQKGLPDV